MENCCAVEGGGSLESECPRCCRRGRGVDEITPKALLRPDALERRQAVEHRFCATPDCPVVYFGDGEVFYREDMVVPVFQKEPAGSRTVCYCFAETEGDIRREIEQTGRSTAFDRITALVQMQRCACEVRNPQGSCCLGNVSSAIEEAIATVATRTGILDAFPSEE